MFKCLTIAIDLFVAIRNEKWYEANELVDNLQGILRTYKEAC